MKLAFYIATYSIAQQTNLKINMEILQHVYYF